MTKTVDTLKTEIAAAFAARVLRETHSNKLKNLAKYEKDVMHDNVVAVLLACNYSADSVNVNVYCVEKQISAARYVAKCDRLDIYTNAIFDSMIALEKSEIEITRDVLASCCSVDAKHANAKVEKAIKATRVQTHKSQSTVATQHNSSVNAMLALHMLKSARNTANAETFTLDRDSYAVREIAALKQIKLVADEVVADATA